MTDSVYYFNSDDSTGLNINSSEITCDYISMANFKFDINKSTEEFQEREFTLTFVCVSAASYQDLLLTLAYDMPPRTATDGSRKYAYIAVNSYFLNVIPCGISDFYHKNGTDKYKLTVRFFSNDTLWSSGYPVPWLY